MSGGQQQRVAIARALVSQPDRDVRGRADGQSRLEDELGDPRAPARVGLQLGQTTVMVTHDARAAAIADRILFLADGEIVTDLGPSTPSEILETLEAVSAR